MNDTFDTFVDNLQERIFEETREAFGELGFERWRNPLYRGKIEAPDGFGNVRGSCGDSIQIYLQFENDRVKAASFTTDGCGSSTVCASLTAEAALGKTPDEIVALTGDDILKRLGTFPEDDQHCAFLAVESLQEALNDYMKKQTRKKDVIN